ncbi:5'/3'-nucleotidase SurE [Oricola thermophila]|uniref:5'-nucleotidase SurE n=1 Tax=Oricola thermophila TaxID=2742145 RepID=A0A6N1V9W8_9HYPH|nr:5'/3'-nucleotidase SurE [Oricola thermophila]QKV17754.1 5'/3'-nucleotidase SurE [Oricola thermophila]
MRILITNDDGIHAEGLAVLERIAATLSDDIWVVAPETDQSGLAHSLTINDPLRLREISERRFALRGTPTDCVIMAVTHIMPEKPDLVLSGVNSGQNLADDVTYSGTVAGAMEGTLLGVRSIAISQAYNFENQRRIVPWEVVETLAPDLLRKLIGIEMDPGTFLNVNFPNCAVDAVEGVEVTRQGKLLHGLYMEERTDGRGFPYFWIRFGRGDAEAPGDSDIGALQRNRISVTPLKLDLTAHEMAQRLEEGLA